MAVNRFVPLIFGAVFLFSGVALLARGEMAGFIFSGVAVVLGAWFWFFTRHIVAVSFDRHGLHLSGPCDHQSVDWESVERIRSVSWVKGRPYSIVFTKPTMFGRRVYTSRPFSESARVELSLELAKHCQVEEGCA